MSERCERCRKGYPAAPPREDLEWLVGHGVSTATGGGSALRIARCTRCGSFLVDRSTHEPGREGEREGTETHDICVVTHESARAALVERQPAALAAISPQVRRRHLERLVASIRMEDRALLERIERGGIECTETFRGLVTRELALAATPAPLPAAAATPRVRADGRDPGGAAGTGTTGRAELDLNDGSRVVLEAARGALSRMRGDAVLWRAELGSTAREAFVARVQGRDPIELVVLLAPGPGASTGELYLVNAADGAARGPSVHALRAASFEARALPAGCVFVAAYQRFALVREDASVAWQGSAVTYPAAVPIESGAVVVDAPWRLVAIALPEGAERWAIPVDRGATLSPAGDGHVLLSTSDGVARLDARGPVPRLAWLASGVAALPLAGGGAAVVRERWDKSVRRVDCVVFSPEGKALFTVSRPEVSKTPVTELGAGVLLFRGPSDVAVSVNERVVYAVSAPEGAPVAVRTDEGGAWVQYDGVVDRIDAAGQRVGRYRAGPVH